MKTTYFVQQNKLPGINVCQALIRLLYVHQTSSAVDRKTSIREA